MNKMKYRLLQSAIALTIASAQDFPQRCGDCWCINGNDTCPTFTTNISYTFSAEMYNAYASFTQTSVPIPLVDASGNTCFPFKDSVGQLSGYDGSALNQCVGPKTTEGVCAFKFTTNNSTCDGRPYELISYSSSDAATADGAVVTHKGPCGVCSSAQDLSVRMKHVTDLASKTLPCAVVYKLDTQSSSEVRFAELFTCVKNLGFSDPCGELWAHYLATNGNLCASNCSKGYTGVPVLNGDPPNCTLSECLQCSADIFQDDFDMLSGRTMSASGIIDAIARPCSTFYPVDQTSCTSTLATAAPTKTSDAVQNGIIVAVLGAVASILWAH